MLHVASKSYRLPSWQAKPAFDCNGVATPAAQQQPASSYSGGGDGRYRKNTTLSFENVTPLDGYTNFGGI
nr:hypothetical protein Hi04_10k_c5714_00025 [uncultured bacterium]